jgi:hypothetical protein
MKKTVKIESNKEYDHIVSLHSLMTNETPVEVFFEDGNAMTYPPGAFKRGNIYDIYCIKLKFDDKAAFTGNIIEKNKLNVLLS